MGELLLDVGLSEVQQHDPFMAGTCQGCNRCISACPTGAIEAPYRVNPYKCLSFLTQQKGIFPRHYRDKLGNRVYGCDRCQEVCPYNVELLREGIKKKPRISDDDVEKVYPRLDFLLGLTNKKFKYFFAGTALGWRGKAVIQRNALIAFGNLGYLTEAVFQAAECENPNLRTHAYWAISKAGGSKNIDYLIKRLKLETDPEALGELHYCLSRYV